MRRKVILVNVIDVEAFSAQFLSNIPSSWDCVVKEIGYDYILEYDMRFEEDVIKALQKAHCRTTLYTEDSLC